MKRIRFCSILILLMVSALVMSVSSCSAYSDFSHEYYGGDKINAEILSEIAESLFRETDKYEYSHDDENSDDLYENNSGNIIDKEQNSAPEDTYSDSDIFYWTQNGEVWHKSKDCRYLKNSKEIFSGTDSDAAAAGKVRPCSACCDN